MTGKRRLRSPRTNDWLQQVARQRIRTRAPKPFVAVRGGRTSPHLRLLRADLPNSKTGICRMPGARNCRATFPACDLTGVDRQYQGKGWELRFGRRRPDRARRTAPRRAGLACSSMRFDEQAAGHYRRFGFEAAPDNPLLLFLSAKVPEQE